MDELPADPWLGGVIGILWLASAATWIILFSRWQQRGKILEYEPRSPVPWGAPVALFAVLYVAVSVWAGISGEAAQGAEEKLTPSDVIQQLSGFIVFQSLLTGGLLFVVAVIYRAGRRDFGLPASPNELVRDVGIGIVAWLASIAPVHGLQALFLYLLGMHEATHPLVKMVTAGEPNVALLLLASVVAVVIAPLTEEVLFRLLLQGWLEKWEDGRTQTRDLANC
jgi:membrane protease YdiL (CAAX protease family)